MSAERSLVPQLEASIRHVKARRWKMVLDDAAARVVRAQDEVDKRRHTSAPSAEQQYRRALEYYFAIAEQMREEMGS